MRQVIAQSARLVLVNLILPTTKADHKRIHILLTAIYFILLLEQTHTNPPHMPLEAKMTWYNSHIIKKNTPKIASLFQTIFGY